MYHSFRNFIIANSIALFFQSCNSVNQESINNSNDVSINYIVDTSLLSNIDTAINNSVQASSNNKLLFDVVGNYFFIDSISGCNINLELYFVEDQLKYTFQTNTRKISDNVELEFNESKDGYYITFNNFKWAENLGTLDDEGNATDNTLYPMPDVDGVLYENEITIQNYGNAMNYYVKIGECDVKYIQLVRK
jgi:hypothetical protein